MKGSDVCRKHEGKLAHGKVTGEIPEKKLKEFLKVEAKARRGSEISGSSMDGRTVKAGGRVARAGFDLGGGRSDLGWDGEGR